MTDCVVLKMGGSLEGAGLYALAGGIARCLWEGRRVVVVHGGGPRITRALKEAGIELPFVNGERITTEAGMAVVERVLAREVNGELVQALCGQEIPAVGLSGADGVIGAAPLPGRGRTARVGLVSTKAIERALAAGMVPVIAPIGRDEAGLTYNINADLAAGAVAGALGASRVVFLTDVPGIYEDWEARVLLKEASASTLEQLLADNRFHQGMIPKVTAVLSALKAGVSTAYVVNGADAAALAWALQPGTADGETDTHEAGNGSVRDFGTRIRQLEAG